jgi:hypothetical protein
MAKKPADAPQAGATETRALPSHIKLLADWGGHLAGRVLAADADLIAQLDTEHAKYRAATAQERSLAGFTTGE